MSSCSAFYQKALCSMWSPSSNFQYKQSTCQKVKWLIREHCITLVHNECDLCMANATRSAWAAHGNEAASVVMPSKSRSALHFHSLKFLSTSHTFTTLYVNMDRRAHIVHNNIAEMIAICCPIIISVLANFCNSISVIRVSVKFCINATLGTSTVNTVHNQGNLVLP